MNVHVLQGLFPADPVILNPGSFKKVGTSIGFWQVPLTL